MCAPVCSIIASTLDRLPTTYRPLGAFESERSRCMSATPQGAASLLAGSATTQLARAVSLAAVTGTDGLESCDPVEGFISRPVGDGKTTVAPGFVEHRSFRVDADHLIEPRGQFQRQRPGPHPTLVNAPDPSRPNSVTITSRS